MKIWITTLLMGLGVGLSAQQNLGITFSPMFSNTGTASFASQLGEGVRKLEVTLPGAHAFIGNTAINYGLIKEIQAGTLSTFELEDLLASMKNSNLAGASVDVNVFGAQFAFKDKSGDPLAIGVGLSQRVGYSAQFSKRFFELVYRGNAPYRGSTIPLGPVHIHASAVTDIHFTFAYKPISVVDSLLRFSPAIRFHYLMGQGALYTEKGEASLFTEQDGRRLEFDFDYAVHVAGEFENFRGKTLGSGFAFDFSSGFDVGELFGGHIAINGVGMLNFSDETRNFRRQGTVVYEGVKVNPFDPSQEDFQADSFLSLVDPIETRRDFSMPLPTTIAVMLEKRMGEWYTRKDRLYHRHRVMLYYVQGLRNMLNATKRPYVAVGYQWRPIYPVQLGANVSVGGLNKLALGLNVGFDLAGLRLGFGSSNFTPLLIPTSGTGVDGYFQLAFAI